MSRTNPQYNIEIIENIIRRKGWFSVSWRWRDAGLRKYCRKFERKGRLEKIPGIKGRDVYTRALGFTEKDKPNVVK